MLYVEREELGVGMPTPVLLSWVVGESHRCCRRAGDAPVAEVSREDGLEALADAPVPRFPFVGRRPSYRQGAEFPPEFPGVLTISRQVGFGCLATAYEERATRPG